MIERTLRWAGPTRCPRCGQNEPTDAHEAACAAWHRQMATAAQAAKTATKLSPSYPVAPAEAIDLLAHLTTHRTPDAETVLQLVLDLGWRPFKGALTAQDATAADPAGTEPLEGL